ncbi:hypothetical protein KUV28_16895 [Ferrimonas balearica]|nr:hypothetical protein [Ferrimonas balearica]
MRWTAFPIPISAVLCLTAGACLRSDPVPAAPPPGPAFCDVEEMRIFSQAEIDWRAAHAPWNLRRDLKTNATWEAECPVEVAS